jgi:hypothetical protein
LRITKQETHLNLLVHGDDDDDDDDDNDDDLYNYLIINRANYVFLIISLQFRSSKISYIFLNTVFYPILRDTPKNEISIVLASLSISRI